MGLCGPTSARRPSAQPRDRHRLVQRAGHRALFAASTILTPKVVRSLVEFAIGSALVAASVSVHASSALPAVSHPSFIERRSRPSRRWALRRRNAQEARTGDLSGATGRLALADRGAGARLRLPVARDLPTERGRRFSDGRSLTDPHLIHPGWVLELPDESAENSLTNPEERWPPRRSAPPPQRHRQPRLTSPDRRPRQLPTPYKRRQLGDGVRRHRTPPPAEPAVQIPSGLSLPPPSLPGLTAHLLGRLHQRRLDGCRALPHAGPNDVPN